jgi:hypothetical protein
MCSLPTVTKARMSTFEEGLEGIMLYLLHELGAAMVGPHDAVHQLHIVGLTNAEDENSF